MSSKVLIVEDEFIVALHLRQTLRNLGFDVIGIAPDSQTAFELAKERPDIALVDVNLRDGETGPEIGRRLGQEHGATVMFLTANPARLGEGIDGALGVVSKPIEDHWIERTLDFLVKSRRGERTTPPPLMRIFADRFGAMKAA